MKVFVTGAAGFIGAAVCHRLLERGDKVFGIDSLNAYYNVALKRARLLRLKQHGFEFLRADISYRRGTSFWSQLERFRPDRVIHLAAQAGVGYSMTNPQAFLDANIQGFLNILEACRHTGVAHLAYASSSSVYGGNTKLPFSVEDKTDAPLSLYAATKKANELMAHSHSHLYGIAATGLRFFNVYGPWGRPDSVLFEFAKKILAGEEVDLYNNGENLRDFTYIDDVVDGIIAVNDRSPGGHRVYNLGRNNPVYVITVLCELEMQLGRRAPRRMLPARPGDSPVSEADMEPFARDFGFLPETPLRVGIKKFVEWYQEYYQ